MIILNNIKSNYSRDLKLNSFKKFEKVFKDIVKNISHQNNILNVLNKNFKFSFKKDEIKKFKKFKKIVLIGMGGSILGTEAIYSFLKHKIKKKVYFLDDLDENKISKIKKKEISSQMLFIIISKSGNTTETLSNAFSLNLFKKNAKNLIIITEKKDNLLFRLSKKLNLFYVKHKNYIGGRYSVLSDVGILPSYLMGLNILKLRSKLLEFIKGNNKKTLRESSIYLSHFLNTKKKNNLIFLNYTPELENLLFWCQQLIAESLGKKNKGFLPIISNAPKDHHSLLQLYLDGPKDKIFNIISLRKNSNLKIKVGKDFKAISFLNNKDLNRVKDSQKNALIKSLIRKKLPFREFSILENNEETLGQIFSYFILETVIIGKILNINPFDQPAVEQVKIDTKKFLAKFTKNNF